MMRSRNYKVGLILTALALLRVVSVCQRQLNQQRTDPKMGLMRVADLGSNAPPMLAFTTVALGGFRGLIANSLWIRANDLQNDGKYFEMVQLADWITKLEPTFAQVWLMQGWNMAYNISVKFSDYGDRWRWVQRGIELLRDEGLKYCPREALVYRELAWFFQHKMGQTLDDAHLYYKAAWAKEMETVLGSGRPNFTELLNPQTDEAKKRVLILHDKYKMDPRVMKEVDEVYGPLEWRFPEAHAIYWATLGLKESKHKDLITLRRVIYQSEAMMVMRGQLYSVEPLRYGPDLSKVDQAVKAYEKMVAESDELKNAIETAQRNFLREVVFLLYTHNKQQKAGELFSYLKNKFPNAVPPGQPLDEFALTRLAGSLKDMTSDKAKGVIEGLIGQYYQNLILGDEDRANGMYLMGQKMWKLYDARTVRDAIRLPPFPEMVKGVKDRLLDPKEGLDPDYANKLRAAIEKRK
ncbi:MAG TPA: hypothetical protein VMZ27_08910 [Candidatus Saccharimonadales bacterium]|nr:hypothetical protein [Candidatus Saccharimonadales bacterium]